MQQDDFNPLPRKEGDDVRTAEAGAKLISIHSLVKRETLPTSHAKSPTRISIHSLVKRETFQEQIASFLPNHFNPLPRKEGDHFRLCRSKRQLFISIHSLVKRETLIQAFPFIVKHISIHSLVKRETIFPNPARIRANISIHSLVKRETEDSNIAILNSGIISIHSLVKRETCSARFRK